MEWGRCGWRAAAWAAARRRAVLAARGRFGAEAAAWIGSERGAKECGAGGTAREGGGLGQC